MFILVLVILLLLFIIENINNSYNKTIITTITIVISENGYHLHVLYPHSTDFVLSFFLLFDLSTCCFINITGVVIS